MAWTVSLFVGHEFTLKSTSIIAADIVSLVLAVYVALSLGGKVMRTVPAQAIVLVVTSAYAAVLAAFVSQPTRDLIGAVQLAEFAIVASAIAALVVEASAGERQRYVTLYIAISAIESCIAIAQTVAGSGPPQSPGRGVGTLSLQLALFLGVAFIVAYARAWSRAGHSRLAWVVVAVVLGAGVLATQTRTAWLALIFCIVLYHALMDWRRALVVATASIFLGSAIIAVGSRGVEPGQGGVRSRLASLRALASGDFESYGNWTARERFKMWDISIEQGAAHPFGVGLKSMREILPRELAERLPERLRFSAVDIYSPHNQFLYSFAELGIVGLIAALALAAISFSQALSSGASRQVITCLATFVTAYALFSDILFSNLGLLVSGGFGALAVIAHESVPVQASGGTAAVA